MERELHKLNLEDTTDKILQKPLSRRGFLRGTAATAVGSIVGFGHDEPSATPEKKDQISPTEQLANPFLQEDDHAEEEHYSSLVNDLSAYGMTAAFAGLVGAVAAEKASFDMRTATAMTGLGAARAAALYAKDREGFHHEMNEHFGKPTMPGGYPLLPVLVGLAEGASHVRAENDEIFRKKDVAEALASEISDAGDLFEQRPEEGSSKEEWVRYYLSVKNSVISNAAKSAALTSVLAPIGTTYTSAAVAKENFKKMYPLLEEAQYAKKIISLKEERERSGEPPTIYPDEIEKLQEEAKNKALGNINGKDGFVHLNIALSTNLNGALLIGDPPLIYFALRHPKLYAEASAYGLAASVMANLAENYIWISRSLGKEDAHKFFSKFFSGQITTLKALGKSLRDGELRDVSFGGARKVTERFMDRITELRNNDTLTEEAAQTLRTQLQDVRQPMFYFDLPTLIDSKIQILTKMLHHQDRKEKKEFVNKDDYGYFGFSDFEALIESDRFLTAFNSPDAATKKDVIKSLRNTLKGEKSDEAVALIGSLLTENPNNAPEVEEVVTRLLGLPLTKTKLTVGLVQDEISRRIPNIEDAHVTKYLQGSLDLLASEANDISSHEVKIRLEHAREYAERVNGNGYANIVRDELKSLLDHIDTLPKDEALVRLQQLAEKAGQLHSNRKNDEYERDMKELHNNLSSLLPKDMKHAMENAFRLSENEDEEHHENRFLGHQAREVRDVLLTQLPAVPSLVHTVQRVLPEIIGVGEDGPNADQLQQMTWAVIASTALTSAFADNVAAYLFGENVLDKIYDDYYGEEYNDGLKKSVYIAALMTAVVAGSLSKIGNGPNVTLSRLGIDGQEVPLTLGSTLGNPYAIAQTAAIATLLNFNIERNKPKA